MTLTLRVERARCSLDTLGASWHAANVDIVRLLLTRPICWRHSAVPQRAARRGAYAGARPMLEHRPRLTPGLTRDEQD
jgi:hypothetical protein